MRTILKRGVFLFVVGALLTSCCDCPQGDPVNIISKATANSLHELYVDNQYAYINEGIAAQYPNNNSLDNVGVLFEDIDDLQKYLQLVKKKAETMGVDKPGVVVYFGARRDGTKTPKSTVFFEAVAKKKDILPFDPNNIERLEFVGAWYNKGRPFKPRPADTTDTDNPH